MPTSNGLLWVEGGAISRRLDQCTADELWRSEAALELQALETVTKLLREVERKLEAFAASDESVKLLRSVPGVERCTAEVVVAYLDNPQRFDTNQPLISATLRTSVRVRRLGQLTLPPSRFEAFVDSSYDWSRIATPTDASYGRTVRVYLGKTAMSEWARNCYCDGVIRPLLRERFVDVGEFTFVSWIGTTIS